MTAYVYTNGLKCHLARIACGVLALLALGSAGAADVYLGGRISNVTTTTQGLMLDTGVPTQCAGTEGNKTMVAAALALWISGARDVTVYVNTFPGSGYCAINQLDPW